MTQSDNTNKVGDISEDDMMGEVAASDSTLNEELIEYTDFKNLKKKLTDTEDKALTERLVLEEKIKLLEEKYMHALADIENVRKQGEKRASDAQKYSITKVLEELVPVLDSLEQSLKVEESEHALIKTMRDGMALTLQMLIKVLEKFGVKEINPEINRDLFNPSLHEVMLTQENADLPPLTITGVMQKGYQLHDRLVRPARVMVVKTPIEKK